MSRFRLSHASVSCDIHHISQLAAFIYCLRNQPSEDAVTSAGIFSAEEFQTE
jgi:hypothetical protein